jgi:hypothetical protein
VVKHQYFSKRDRQSRGTGRPPKIVAVERAVAHVKYIQHRPGPDRPEGGRELFTEFEDKADAKTIRKLIRDQENSKVVAHKLTLAPEIDPEDKKAFTREIMHKLASEKGLDLIWYGAEHSNTDHHHIHLVVLGKDRNGVDVRINKGDYDKIKEWGDRYLERCHPLEFERARQEREEKERDRIEQRKKERELAKKERTGDRVELAWLRKKIIREQLEPYTEWKKKQDEREAAKVEHSEKESEKPYFQDTIEAAGKDWSRGNSLQELRDLNQYLWDNYEERIPIKDFKKLNGWIKDKEKLKEPEDRGESQPDEQTKSADKKSGKQKDSLEYKGEEYGKEDSYERLVGLVDKLRENKKERLPIDDYQMLRGWIENRDRERFAGSLDDAMKQAKQQHARETSSRNRGSERYVDPVQQEVMSNPVVGVFMSGASIVNTVVSWIDLRDNRDLLKEGREGLEDAKRSKHDDYLKRGKKEDRDRDEAAIENIDKALDENKTAREKREEEKKRKDQERKHDPFKYDPWGQY